jgi:hypothetical protein
MAWDAKQAEIAIVVTAAAMQRDHMLQFKIGAAVDNLVASVTLVR